MCIYFWLVIGFNKIVNLGIDFELTHKFYNLYDGNNTRIDKKSLPVE